MCILVFLSLFLLSLLCQVRMLLKVILPGVKEILLVVELCRDKGRVNTGDVIKRYK